MKVAFLSHYNLDLLEKTTANNHPGVWIKNLAQGLSDKPKLELHIITLSKDIDSDIEIKKGNILFHILKIPSRGNLFFFAFRGIFVFG